jgi:hypothetical protein
LSGYVSLTGSDGVTAVSPGNPLPVTTAATTGRTAKGYQQIASLAAAQTLTAPAGATFALVACEGQAVRWRDDGTAPTAAVGMELWVGQTLIYDGPLAAISFIQEAAGAKLNVAFYA